MTGLHWRMIMMRMSKTFVARWDENELDGALDAIVLQPRLRALTDAPFVRRDGALPLEPLVANATGAEAFPDRTGYEAFINKVHVDDLVEACNTSHEQLGELIREGAKAAVELSQRLESEGTVPRAAEPRCRAAWGYPALLWAARGGALGGGRPGRLSARGGPHDRHGLMTMAQRPVAGNKNGTRRRAFVVSSGDCDDLR